ncbi:hypothetical protein EPN28_02815 [Patescibacteria group bacterium]|nr:MAG: hypothetical protein EPN28_02815 [Patescibacteria group bacterium]
MNHKILITRPNYDLTTRYISSWAKNIIKFAEEKGSVVLDLEKERANRKEFESMIRKHEPPLIFLNGHGDYDLVTGQEEDVLVRVGDNETLLDSKVVYALSCRSGKKLGPESVKRGAKAYIGYKEDFIFLYNEEQKSRPEQDKTAEIFSEPSNQVMVSLLKNHTAKEACKKSKESYFRRIRKLLYSKATSAESAVVRFLIWDMQNLVCYEQEAQK